MTERSEIDQMTKFLLATQNLEAPPASVPTLPGSEYDTLPADLLVTDAAPDLADLNGYSRVAAPSMNANDIAVTPMPVGSGAVSEMKDILARFHGAAGNIIAEAPMDRPLREALITEETPQGARIGHWEIVVNPVGKKRKVYDVVHAMTHQKLASELLIYEAALGLVRHLNNGGRINSSEVLDLLKSEQEYAGAIHDMRLYKHHLTKTPNSPRAAIYEDRYGQAKRKAVAARDRVEKLSESI